MAMHTYLIYFRDRQLALAVGAELEDRLSRDGREAVALVSAADGLRLARADAGRRGAWRGSYLGAPRVVALYEEGLLAQLESLGLTAYVGTSPEYEPTVVRWGNGGAMLLPVATARDLVDAVADHTPWAAHAARMALVSPPRRDTGVPWPTPPALSRKLAVAAGIAGPLLLAGLPAAASAADAPAHHGSAKAGTTAVLASKIIPATKTASSTLPASLQNLLNELQTLLQRYLQQTQQGTSSNAQTATQTLQNQISQLANTLANALAKAGTQPAQAASQPTQAATQPAQSATQPAQQNAGQAPTNAGSQGSQNQNQQNQQDPQDQSQQDPQDQSQQDPQDQSQQNPQDQSQQNSGSQNSTTSQGSTSQQGSTSMQGSASSGMGTTSLGSTSSGGSFSGGASSGGTS